jgi:hypothetical protein
VRIYTAHFRPDRPPVLVKEAFALGAFLFGPVWLLAHRAWMPAIASIMVFALCWAVPMPLRGAVLLGAMVLHGVFGRDLVRWALGWRGYALAHVVAGRNADDAYLRLLSHVP